jgi:rare lipoprotein A
MTIKYLKNPKFVFLTILLTVFNIGLNSLSAQASSNKTNRSFRVKTPVLPNIQNQSLTTNFASVDSSSVQKQIIPLKEQTILANTFSGRASWYGPKFHGRRTANGEVFNQNALTAAHPYLKFGTKVKVTNLHNGRSVVVRINDRGPFAGNRVIDLSAAAAQTIKMISSGIAPVRVTVLGR